MCRLTTPVLNPAKIVATAEYDHICQEVPDAGPAAAGAVI